MANFKHAQIKIILAIILLSNTSAFFMSDSTQKISVPPHFSEISPEIADVTIGNNNGTGQAWRVSDDKTALTHSVPGTKADSYQWQTTPARDDQGNTISPLKNIQMSLDGKIMLLQDNAGDFYRYDWDKSYFVKLAPSYAYTHKPEDNTYVITKQPLHVQDLSIGNAHNIWAVDKKNQIIYQLNETSGLWYPRTNGISVSAGGDGSVLIVDTKGTAQMHTGNNAWAALPGVRFKKVAISNKNYMIGLSSDGNVWQFDGTKKSWQQLMDADNNPVGSIKNIRVNPLSALVLIGNDGTIYSNGKHMVSIHQRILKSANAQQQKTKTAKKASQMSRARTVPTKNDALKVRKTRKTSVKAPSDDNPAE